MKRRIVLIGQAPGRVGGNKDPLSGRSADVLARLCCISRTKFLRAFARENVLARWPGKNGKGDAFPIQLARRRAAVQEERLRGRRVIFLGRNVARAFGAANKPILEWFDLRGFDKAAIVPHPSGVNRWYNPLVNRQRTLMFLRSSRRRGAASAGRQDQGVCLAARVSRSPQKEQPAMNSNLEPSEPEFTMRVYAKVLGGHTHVGIWIGRRGSTLGKAGDICMTNVEFNAWRENQIGMEFVDAS